MRTCPSRERLAELLTDQLSTPEQDTLERHVGDCTACQQHLQELIGAAAKWSSWKRLLQEARSAPAEESAGRAPAAGPAAWPTVPGYEILGELGRGGMGVVYKARQRALDRLVALKLLTETRQTDPEFRRRLRQEAEAVARLPHPNLVQIHDLLEQGDSTILVLQFIDGDSLAAQLRAATLPPTAAAALVETLARAMQAAHTAGILHRDLKPANVLLQIADYRLQISEPQSATCNLQFPKSRTSAWPASWRRPGRRRPARCWARRATWPQNRLRARAAGAHPPWTSTPSAPSCTRR